MSIPASDFVESDDSDSDSDAVSDAAGPENDYRPISAMDDSDDDSKEGDISVHPNGDGLIHRDSTTILTPVLLRRRVENGVSNLDLNGGGRMGVEEQEEEEEEEEEDEEEREREASIHRAFREDESRRSAPLSRENTARVMEAMRAVSFQGFTPDWANQLPEDLWMDHLRNLRRGGESTPQI